MTESCAACQGRSLHRFALLIAVSFALRQDVSEFRMGARPIVSACILDLFSGRLTVANWGCHLGPLRGTEIGSAVPRTTVTVAFVRSDEGILRLVSSGSKTAIRGVRSWLGSGLSHTPSIVCLINVYMSDSCVTITPPRRHFESWLLHQEQKDFGNSKPPLGPALAIEMRNFSGGFIMNQLYTTLE